MSISTTLGGGPGEVLQRVLGAGVLAQAAETVRPVEQTGQRPRSLSLFFDDGNGDGHIADF